jgi:hypothetical protein
MADNSAATIDVSYGEGIVTMTVRGRITQEVGDQLTRRSVAALREHAARRLLQDFRRARMVETTLQLMQRSRQADALGFPQDTRVALLYSVRTTGLEFLESLLESRGRAFRAFTDGAAALAYLRES